MEQKPDAPDPPDDMEATSRLVERARSGDRTAIEALCARYLPRLNRWARGRLPRRARDLLDTGDVAQEVLLRTIRKLDDPAAGGIEGFNAYLRQALNNRIRDELRRVGRQPEREELDIDRAAPGPSPLESAVGRAHIARYEAALQALRIEDREAIVARFEMGCSYSEIAGLLRKPTANAARMCVLRALERLVRGMGGSDPAST